MSRPIILVIRSNARDATWPLVEFRSTLFRRLLAAFLPGGTLEMRTEVESKSYQIQSMMKRNCRNNN